MKTKFLSFFLLFFSLVVGELQVRAMDADEIGEAANAIEAAGFAQEVEINRIIKEISDKKNDMYKYRKKNRREPLELVQELERPVLELFNHVAQGPINLDENIPQRRIHDCLTNIASTGSMFSFYESDLQTLKLMLKLTCFHPNQLVSEGLPKNYLGQAITHSRSKALSAIAAHMVKDENVDRFKPLHILIEDSCLINRLLRTGIQGFAVPLQSNISYIKLFLENGASPNMPYPNGTTLMQRTDNEEIQKLLLLHGADVVSQKSQVLKDEFNKKFKKDLEKYRAANLTTKLVLVKEGLTDEALIKNVFNFIVPFTLDEQIKQNQQQAQKRKATMSAHLAKYPDVVENPAASMKSFVLTGQSIKEDLRKNGFYNTLLPKK